MPKILFCFSSCLPVVIFDFVHVPCPFCLLVPPIIVLFVPLFCICLFLLFSPSFLSFRAFFSCLFLVSLFRFFCFLFWELWPFGSGLEKDRPAVVQEWWQLGFTKKNVLMDGESPTPILPPVGSVKHCFHFMFEMGRFGLFQRPSMLVDQILIQIFIFLLIRSLIESLMVMVMPSFFVIQKLL